MPGNNAVSFAGFDAIQHLIELRTPLGHGALCFFEAADDVQALLPHQVADFGQLVANGAGLTFLAAAGLTNVEKVANGFVHDRALRLAERWLPSWYSAAMASRSSAVAASQ